MKKKLFLLFVVLLVHCYSNCISSKVYVVKSPNEKLSVSFLVTSSGEPYYTISHVGSVIIKQSRLGVVRSDGDFTANLSLDSVSSEIFISEKYKLLHGKRLNCEYIGKRRVFYLKNNEGKPMQIIFQVSNDGIGFRYFFPEQSDTVVKIYREATSFHFDISTKAFLQPCPDARTGWCFTQPSYEEYYKLEIPVGSVSPYQAGWVMPALFRYGKYWISITETAVDTNYCGSRLSQFSPDGEYTIQFPQPQESRFEGHYLPESKLPWYTPWRVVVVVDNLGGIVESTLGTDLANPAEYDASSWLEPGIASWSWVILKDDSTVYDVQRRYIDFASTMKWKYCLIDAFWDKQIGYEKVKELVKYAGTKNVKIFLWYNSAGDWNSTTLSPRDKLLTRELRYTEFQKLQEIGISGIKVDFFGGDGRSMMKYYIEILKDAEKFHLAVNFHGCTYPRGWHRTYPNLVSMEAIRGEEYVTFSQYFADNQPWHCTVIPFTRNLFDPMDFTPVNFSGVPNIKRRTTMGFELALSVLFTSGVQHIAETPEGMSKQNDFIIEFMRTVPNVWDDVKFIDGYPGKYVVLARRKEDVWYIAGINGENSEHELELNLSFISKTSKGIIITDSEDGNSCIRKNLNFSKPVKIKMYPYGGFVIKTL